MNAAFPNFVVHMYVPTSDGKPGAGFEKAGFRFWFQKTQVPGSGFGFSKLYKFGKFRLKNWHFLPNHQIGAIYFPKIWELQTF